MITYTLNNTLNITVNKSREFIFENYCKQIRFSKEYYESFTRKKNQ